MSEKYEYKVVRLGTNVKKNAELLNKKSDEGWELVSTVPVQKLHETNGQIVSDVQAYLRRPQSEGGTVING